MIDYLFDQLPKHDVYHQRWSYRQQHWQPLFWRGYRQSTAYSYVIPEPQYEDVVWRGLHGNVRKNIRKAEGRFGMKVKTGSPAELHGLVLDTFSVQGIPCPVSLSALTTLYTAAAQRSAGEILIAEDEEGRPCAGAVFVFDRESTWYLIGGDHAERRTTGAMSCVLWEGIRRAGRRGTLFDFEGSMLPRVERFFRAFGGEPKPYLTVSGSPSRLGQAALWRMGVGFPSQRSR